MGDKDTKSMLRKRAAAAAFVLMPHLEEGHLSDAECFQQIAKKRGGKR